MIHGGHVVIYSRDAEADRAFLRDVLKFPFVDAHGGWLIFKLPPSEVAVHPAEENDCHEFFLMTDDLDAEMAALKKAGTSCEASTQQGWGRLTRLRLPGGGSLGLYQPRGTRGPEARRRAKTRRSISLRHIFRLGKFMLAG